MQGVYTHAAQETRCTMRFGVFLPPQAQRRRVPVLYWLSGLTCTEENFIVKAGAQRVAAELGLAIVVPDTSPRGLGIPGEADSYDFGLGAGFYVDATEAPWSAATGCTRTSRRSCPRYVDSRFRRRRRSRRHLRPFDGRPRRADDRAEESRPLSSRCRRLRPSRRRCAARGAKRR